jgi:MFS family permease
MLGFSTYAALLPELRDLRGLSNSQAGLIGGMFFAGYIGTVSLWTALTDRVDGRKVYVAGSALAVAGSAGFGLLAEGLVSAIVLQGLLGAGMLGPVIFGAALDAAGGAQKLAAWILGYFAIGACCLAAPLVARLFRRSVEST